MAVLCHKNSLGKGQSGSNFITLGTPLYLSFASLFYYLSYSFKRPAGHV